jgi:hypothetical protein
MFSEESTKKDTGARVTHESASAQAAQAISSIPQHSLSSPAPICKKSFAIYADLKQHYITEHADAVSLRF